MGDLSSWVVFYVVSVFVTLIWCCWFSRRVMSDGSSELIAAFVWPVWVIPVLFVMTVVVLVSWCLPRDNIQSPLK